jgi:hypothetical protein
VNTGGFAECIKMKICRDPDVNFSWSKNPVLGHVGSKLWFLKSSKTIHCLYLAGWFGWLAAYMIGKSEIMLNQVCLINESNNVTCSKRNKLNLVKTKRLLSSRIFSNTSYNF